MIRPRSDLAEFFTLTFTCICILTYAAFLQFHAATASVGENFTPGITMTKILFSPGWFLTLLCVITILSRSAGFAQVYNTTTLVAMALCIFWTYIIAQSDGLTSSLSEDDQRQILRAFTSTNYSNRSYFVAFYGFFIAGAHWLISRGMVEGLEAGQR